MPPAGRTGRPHGPIERTPRSLGSTPAKAAFAHSCHAVRSQPVSSATRGTSSVNRVTATARSVGTIPTVRPGYVRPDVMPRHTGDEPGLDPEEPAHAVHRLPGGVAQFPVAQQQYLLAREQPEQVLELLAVAALRGVVPEVRPACLDPLRLPVQRRGEVRPRARGRPRGDAPSSSAPAPRGHAARRSVVHPAAARGSDGATPGRRGRRRSTPRTAPRAAPRRTAPRRQHAARRAHAMSARPPGPRPSRAAARRSGRTSAPWASRGTTPGDETARHAGPRYRTSARRSAGSPAGAARRSGRHGNRPVAAPLVRKQQLGAQLVRSIRARGLVVQPVPALGQIDHAQVPQPSAGMR